jgi:hypothetical protein
MNIMPYLLLHWRLISIEAPSPLERDEYPEDVRLEDILEIFNNVDRVCTTLREIISRNDWSNTRSVGIFSSQTSIGADQLWPTQDSYEDSSAGSCN